MDMLNDFIVIYARNLDELKRFMLKFPRYAFTRHTIPAAQTGTFYWRTVGTRL